MNNYQYRCKLTNACGNIFTVTATLSVTVPVTPSIIISTPVLTNCPGITVGFTAAITNGGSAPAYQWKRNGAPFGLDRNNITVNDLADGEIITCTLASSAGCLTSSAASSNALTMIVPVPQTASVTITSSANSVCAGTPITFNATPVNEGVNPGYTWFRNGTNLFLNATTYTASNLNNGDNIFCVLGSSLACITNPVALSNIIIAGIIPAVTPAITISASKNAICKNESIVFTSAITNGGANPLYQWIKNGVAVSSSGNSNFYGIAGLLATDIISCQLISDAGCTTSNTVLSNNITVPVYTDPVVQLDHNDKICENNARLLDAGNFASYLWSSGEITRTIRVTGTGNWNVTVTDNHGCKATDATSITSILAAPSGFLGKDTAICFYETVVLKPLNTYKSYSWNNGSANSSIAITQPGEYSLEVTDNNNCTGKDFITVKPKQCLQGLYVPSGFTPNDDGKNDLLKAMLFGNIKQFRFQIYDRWGQLVFMSTDPAKGWDGTVQGLKRDNAVFIWTCFYQLENEKPELKRGTVTLIK